MPFVTEEIFCTIQSEEESIMVSDWPVYQEAWNFAGEESAIELMKEAVRGIRNVRTQMNVAPSRKAAVYLVSENEEVRDIFESEKDMYAGLMGASEVIVAADKTNIAQDAVSIVIPDAVVYIPLEELVDMEKEKERLFKEKERLEKEIARAKGMLGNERFLSKAPEAKVQEEKDKLLKYEQMMEQVNVRISSIK